MKLIIAFLCLFMVSSCNRIYTDSYNNPLAPTNPLTPTNPILTKDLIEFRVSGNCSSALIRFNNALDGLSQLTTSLPYVAIFESNRDNIFLSLEATPGIYPTSVQVPFLSVQIYVNGKLFREANSSSFLANTISVSGTYRR